MSSYEAELSDYPSAHQYRVRVLLLRRMALRIVKGDLKPPEVYRQRSKRARAVCVIAALVVVGVLIFAITRAIDSDLAEIFAAMGVGCALITVIVFVRADDKAARSESTDQALQALSGQLSKLRNDYTGRYDDTDVEDDLALIDALSKNDSAFPAYFLTVPASLALVVLGIFLAGSLVDYLSR